MLHAETFLSEVGETDDKVEVEVIPQLCLNYHRQINSLLCLIYCYLRVCLCRNDSLTNPDITTLYIKSAY